MSISVRIPTPLRRLTQGRDEVTARGNTVGEVIEDLEEGYPGIKERLYDEDGRLRRFVNIYVNGEDVRFLSGLQTGVRDGDEISILPAVAGGVPIKKRFWLTFPQKLIKEPIIYRVGHDFKVITNIRTASISEEIGLVGLELEGEPEEIERAVAYMRSLEIGVEPIELDIIE